MTKTLWALEQDQFEESDAVWCRGLGVEWTVKPLFGNLYLGGKLSSSVQRGLLIRISTTCERQETMLKLKYGHRLIEIQRDTASNI